MSPKLRKTRLFGSRLVPLLAVIALTAAAQTTPVAPGEQSGAPKTTEQVYKNIKVLKGIPANQLIPAMEFITASLGVKCDHCHAEGHFDSDEKKPKETARKMMTMMFAINRDNFEGKREVTCYSCHRGADKPLQTPLMGQPGQPQLAAMAEGTESARPDLNLLPAPNDLIDKYVQALGGEAAIKKISSRVVKGTVSGMGGHTFPSEVFYKAPDQSATTTHFPNGNMTTTFDGHEGWMIFPGRPPRKLEGAALDAAEMDGDLHFAVNLKTMFSSFKVAAPESVDGHEAFHILAMRTGEPPVGLYFDEESGLLVRLVRNAESPLGLYPTQIDYADYREDSGVKVPFRVTTSRPGSNSILQIEQLRQNVPIPDSRFVAPQPPKPPQK